MLVAAGGALGAVMRHTVGRFIGPPVGPSIPWNTLVVNASGGFLIGLLLVLSARFGLPGWWRPLIAVGVLGGYTTFSTFSMEVVDLALQGRFLMAASYAGGSLVAAVGACGVGVLVGRSV
jgi:fluoride exporter